MTVPVSRIADAPQYDAQIVVGECDDGMPFVPGVNCIDCGKFVGRDGHIAIEHFEMSFEVASVDGMCASCLHGEGASR